MQRYRSVDFGLLLLLAHAIQCEVCPELSLGGHMHISQTTGYVGDGPVLVTCQTGYKLDTEELEKYILCDSGGVWNDTVGTCSPKQCPSLTTALSHDMTSTWPSSGYTVGDEVTIECVPGYAFSMNLSAEIGSRVAREVSIQCVDNVNTVNGTWNISATCSQISCGTPPEVYSSFRNYTSDVLGSTVQYLCHSGSAWSAFGELYTMTAKCNDSGVWETDLSENGRANKLTCKDVYNYKGCGNMSCMVETNHSLVHGDTVDTCVDFCHTGRHRYAALLEGECFCSDDLNEAACPMQPDTLCTSVCESYVPNVTESNVPVFCGGPNNMASIYLAFAGRYTNVTTVHLPREFVLFHERTTCRERCRASGTTHAGLAKSMCYCLNITDIDGHLIPINATDYPNSLRVYDTTKYAVKHESCEELFKLKIRQAGTYYLNNPLRLEWCDFLDGTMCDPFWVGYRNSCYITNNNDMMDFNNAREFCQNKNAELVTILTEDEKDFLNTFIKFFPVYGNKSESWWLGMVDNRNSSLFLWLDGNIMFFSSFDDGKPSESSRQCATGNFDMWQEEVCDVPRKVMCKKEAGWSDCFNVTNVVSAATFRSEAMTLTLCVEVCKGQEAMYALVKNDTCTCSLSEVEGVALPKSDCSNPCLGHSLQYCGGSGTAHTYLKLEGRHLARSCDDLQMIGLESNQYKLLISDTPTQQVCPDPMCPYAWLSVGAHCYKASLASITTENAVEACSKEDAYMVTIETKDELDSLYEKLSRISVYSAVDQWKIGLNALHMNGGLYKWSNGRTVDPDLWNNTVSGRHGYNVVISTGTSNYTWTAVETSKDAYICEKGQDYVGCYSSITSTIDACVDNYSYMTVELCVETCRAGGAQFAYVNNTACQCSNVLTSPSPGECNSVCSGQTNQVCGGENGQMSVYNITEYPPIGNTCNDLFDAGITLSGDYIVNGSASPCHFVDGTLCDSEYIGYLDNCYLIIRPERGVSRADACRAENATQTSLTSRAEYEAISSYIKRVHMPIYSRPFSGITNGGYDLDIFISEDGLLVDKELIDSGKLYTQDLHDDQGYVSFRLDTTVTLNSDGGVICKKNKYHLGCYTRPTSIIPVLENYNSVELTLCKQMCSVEGHNVTLIGKYFCACTSLPEMSSFTQTYGTSCDEPCAIHKDQYCGDGTVVWAHLTGNTDLADNCTSLYKSGVFYNTTYVLENTANAGTVRLEQCGFTDTTDCPPTWLGHEGGCFKFNIEQTDYQNAVTECMLKDGVLFNPINTSQLAIVDEVLKKSGLFTGLSHWHSGVLPVLYNAMYVSSDGTFIKSDLSNTTNKPVTTAAYDVERKTWFETNSDLPYICQKNEDFLGCHAILTEADAEYESDWNSMTMCVQWCYGQDMQYVATHVRSCACYSQLPIMTQANGHCDKPCEGVRSQPCGGILSNGTEVYSVRKLAYDTLVLPSCMDLLYYGMTEPGIYYVQYNASYPPMNVSCLTDERSHAILTDDDIWYKTGSSAKPDYGFPDLSFKFPRAVLWKPTADDGNQHVKIWLQDKYIVTGVITAGHPGPPGVSFVHTYTLMYRETQTGEMITYEQNGTSELKPNCHDVLGVCLIFLARPFVTDEVLLQPVAWQHSIAMQMALYGQIFSDYNPFNLYSGCYLDYDSDSISAGTTLDIDGCIDHCHSSDYPFASLDENGACICRSRGIDNGQLHDEECGFNTTGQYRFNQNNSWAIYNTYVVLCPDPNMTQLVNGNVSNLMFPITDNVFSFGSSLNFTCNEGYEFMDGSESEIIYCLHNNTWTNLTKTCQIISCPSFTVNQGHVNFTSHHYQGMATVTCNPGLWTESRHEHMTVQCEANKQWTIVPTCTVHNRHSHQMYYQIFMDTVRVTSFMIEEMTSRSKTDCASKCTENYLCKAANYRDKNSTTKEGACRLFSAVAESVDLSSELGWVYLET